MRTLVLAILVACSNGKPTPTTPRPVAPANGCAEVADHLMSLMTPTAQQAPTEDLDRMRKVFTTRCEEDKWSADARACMVGLTALTESERCAQYLEADQTQSVERAVEGEAKPAPGAPAPGGAVPTPEPAPMPVQSSAPPQPDKTSPKRDQKQKLRSTRRKPPDHPADLDSSDPCEGGE